MLLLAHECQGEDCLCGGKWGMVKKSELQMLYYGASYVVGGGAKALRTVAEPSEFQKRPGEDPSCTSCEVWKVESVAVLTCTGRDEYP